jgi:hypothetical protein
MHGGGHPVDGVDERQVQFGFEIGASCGAGAARSARPSALIPAATEELGEEPGEITTVFEAIAAATWLTESARHRAEPAHLVVLLALGLVAEHVVGRADLLEPLFGLIVAGVRVRVMLAGQLSVRASDVLRVGGLGHPEHVVIVLLEPLSLRSHPGSPSRRAPHAARDQSRTLTSAGRKTRPFHT